ncbi:Cell wall surface anchor family protein [Streptococcus suis]|uniref:SpaH/EbpB family LPXTG-anchored major pilin n=1 Tax=Streptococcus suis TaxID=1307 RepID=UPI000429013E|nr:SpaH/EbpB family LPXTG-anchored major pilin [Streptococcus suis]VTT13168.1 Cell wall surface anchor family protein [Streptococcus suis]HEM3201789.1 SpaH/EbpB family LPXTG-anchored major pilin [Streptococcus suis]HEM4241577.1 SpaH/EbpB family LPXTG-anchored major pilin [Streptococcus suis]HEM5403594.1 SpaH/EbpB family LPXTG-anchored major pilin [Streptococcus suis]
MRKKFIASLLISVLLTFNLASPVLYALETTGDTSTAVTQESQVIESSKEVVFRFTNSQTSELVSNITVSLLDTVSGELVESWTVLGQEKMLNLIAGKSYTLRFDSADGFANTADIVLTVDETGQISTLQADGSWLKSETSGVLDSKLDPVPVITQESTSTVQATADTSSTTATETSTLDPVNTLIKIPTILLNGTTTMAASYQLLKESDSSEIAVWTSSDANPEIELLPETIYHIRFQSIQTGYQKPSDVIFRLNQAGTFERLIGETWSTVTQFEVDVYRSSVLRAGSSTSVGSPITVSPTTIAPINRLQIIGNMPSTSKVELISYGTGYNRSQIVWGNAPADNPIWGGGFDTNLDSVIASAAPNHNGLTVEFKPSNASATNYKYDPNAGWSINDLSLTTTTMWVKVKYTDAAYYDGELVDAYATIKVTPFKTRTNRSQSSPNGGYNYWGNKTYADNDNNKPIYYPTIQISGLLYGGWVRQNVDEFNVDLSFYRKGSDTPITLKGGTFDDEEATYYTINSLNPEYNYTDGAAHGPEYVLPENGTITAPYTVQNSNIRTRYDGDDVMQYAYHGGINFWGNNGEDTPTSPLWNLNSVMFTTTDTTKIKMTLGDLDRKPGKHALNNPAVNSWDASTVYRSNYIWSTINTDAFTSNQVTSKNINVRKNWIGQANPTNAVTIELWATWKQDGVQKESFRQRQTLSTSNNWQASFIQVPDETSMLKIIQKLNPGARITDFKYKTVEVNLPDGYSVKYSGDSFNGFTVTNTQVEAGLVVTKKWLDNGQAIANQNTSNFGNIKVTLKRKFGQSVDGSFSQVIELEYNSDANLSWKKTVNNLMIQDSYGRKCTYFIEEDTSTIPDNFYIRGYTKQDIQLSYNTNDNQLEVENERKQSQLVIQKLWYKSDGTTPLANENLPSTLKAKIFRTTDGTTSGGELYKEVTLTRQATSGTYIWKTTETVPVRDKTGKLFYTYYIEEENLQGYLEISNSNEKYISFTSSSAPLTVTLTLKNKVNPTYPATGGFGNLPYLMIGMFSIFMAIIIQCLQKKRKVFGEENMKKFTKILFTLFVALSLIVSSLGSVIAFAEQANAPAAGEKYDIVLTKVKLTDLSDWPKQTGVDNSTYTGQELTVQDYFGDGAETLANVWFEVHQGTADGPIVKEGLTGADGTITFTGLSAGKYYIVENKAKSKLTSSEQLANSAAVPVEIELPVFKASGGWYTTGKDAVHVYPKNTVDKPSLDKVVNESDKHDTALIGEARTFKITSTMPEGIKDYQELTFDDTFSAGLSYAGKFKATLKRGANTTDIAVGAYEFDEPKVGTKKATLKIEFTPDYIKTLEPGDVITLTYDATINEDAIMGAANPNDISLTYGTNPSETKTVVPTTPPNEETPNPELHTGGKKFKKQDKVSQAGLSGAQFVVKNSDGTKFLKQTTVDGKVTKTEWVDSQETATVFTSQADGTFEVVGLPYGTANQKASEGRTDYQLVEIKAPEGYAKLQQPITFTVNATSYYQDPAAVKLVAADPQNVDNNKVTIPQTGGIGSVVVIVAGVLVAGFGLTLKRRLAK